MNRYILLAVAFVAGGGTVVMTYWSGLVDQDDLCFLGGWPGALVGRKVFRHKTSKQPFRTIFWCTVIANCVVLAWFLYEAPVSL